MKSNYKRLGDYIAPVEGRNTDLKDIPLMGLSINKVFIPSIANTVGTNMATYRIIQRNQFGYGPVTSRNGDKITIALFEEHDEALISQAYIPFEVEDTQKLLPQYLMMWFRRPEFDRYARFMSHGSAREIFSWEEMQEVKLPIPHPDKQREIVAEYSTIENRIKLNEQFIQKLEETAQAVYREWFVENIDLENLPKGWKNGVVSDICNYSAKRVPVDKLSLENYISTENMLQERGGIIEASGLPNSKTVTGYDVGNVLISNIRPYFKKIWQAIKVGGCSNDVLCFVPKPNIPAAYLYQVLEKDDFFEYVMAGSKGTKMPRGDKDWIMKYPVVVPDTELLKKYNDVASLLQKDILIRKKENRHLTDMKELFLSKLASMEN